MMFVILERGNYYKEKNKTVFLLRKKIDFAHELLLSTMI